MRCRPEARMTIDTLPDNVLLEISDLYLYVGHSRDTGAL